MNDQQYMKQALRLAKQAQGRTSPNPLVGAIIVKEGEIIGQGYHHYAGGAHAEVNALEDAKEEVVGSTMYVTLEPCTHYGKTPPCTETIIEAGIKRVVIAMKDPNPKVAGQGVERLRRAGVEVDVGLLAVEAKELNEIFIKYITTKRPFVILKNAVTLDGKIATKTGDSKWITGTKSREFVHKLRDQVDAILVGIGTVLSDNPRLTTRLSQGGQDPIRIILDSKLRISSEAKVIKQESKAKTIVATTDQASLEKKEELEKNGVKVVKVGNKAVDLELLLEELGKQEITSLLVEGGSQVNASFWEANLVDKLYYFIAPKIIGGSEAISVVTGAGVEKVKDGVKLDIKTIKEVGDDILMIGYPDYK
ncbi:2,5-diamino-6-hydroxy-4-(5-phosphoribosylamino)pyrimidine 1'-reductase [Halobacteroides halobius DSM 5150]|uniref:Riboflavin biosynthesis protein RibD n=1 Tax=Halobacteroides halobius (strain ATCC 35273 / DSM 5150 / MD-1) TaxID=748449 RepID=L0K9T8_HALHC|nr:bifunctional diaminohydroxyphosphoribosylaminopyrimidine deaminase/5-amino-6-(5-phosphoribosylamino)uracil reductase RibD [Halobacteroides halobius]AGB40858.1 2,5-diamino-6-hydroxy-4-(5-phosphoribosylamino)pyrimidine 1'-reductase [Halobacteroides halobius DSM 5150]